MIAVDDFQQKNVSFSMVAKKDLPAHCPPVDAQKWSMHPKVFLQFDADGNANCPYCGSKYKLAN
ncbi:MAG: zinc-finger domain-containing protein [Candidatus Thioglobus sp.]|nr:MAG: zinc-finger domain-containing protein [Candidatus Thioglobus sp.]KAA0450258.1 MAG: zinc-finger domain-containing protein [Candidatus Thioglobus sp.]